MTNETQDKWQVIAERPRGAMIWPKEYDDVIAAYRADVEAGTHIMHHRHFPDRIELVVQKRKRRGEPVTSWQEMHRSRRHTQAQVKYAGKNA